MGYVSRVKDVESNVDESTVTSEQIESNAVRCPDTDAAEQMYTGVTCDKPLLNLSQYSVLCCKICNCMQSLMTSASKGTHVVVRSLVLYAAVQKDWVRLYLAS